MSTSGSRSKRDDFLIPIRPERLKFSVCTRQVFVFTNSQPLVLSVAVQVMGPFNICMSAGPLFKFGLSWYHDSNSIYKKGFLAVVLVSLPGFRNTVTYYLLPSGLVASIALSLQIRFQYILPSCNKWIPTKFSANPVDSQIHLPNLTSRHRSRSPRPPRDFRWECLSCWRDPSFWYVNFWPSIPCFPGGGFTVVYLLSESSIHTWPEHSFAALDIYNIIAADRLVTSMHACIAEARSSEISYIERGSDLSQVECFESWAHFGSSKSKQLPILLDSVRSESLTPPTAVDICINAGFDGLLPLAECVSTLFPEIRNPACNFEIQKTTTCIRVALVSAERGCRCLCYQRRRWVGRYPPACTFSQYTRFAFSDSFRDPRVHYIVADAAIWLQLQVQRQYLSITQYVFSPIRNAMVTPPASQSQSIVASFLPSVVSEKSNLAYQTLWHLTVS